MATGRRWTIRDQSGHAIYLTQERRDHITAPLNHPEMIRYEEHLKETVESGQRRQDGLNPQKYRYAKAFADLPEHNTHMVAIALFRFRQRDDGKPHPNNYFVTAYMKELR